MPQRTLKNISNGNFSDRDVSNLAANLGVDQVPLSKRVGALYNHFSTLFQPNSFIAVAVSGGADSMALCLLLHDWSKLYSQKIMALVVDHGLRQETRKEIQKIVKWLSTIEVSYEILYWKDKKPSTGIQSAARSARYGLMLQWCHNNNFKTLVTGHHLEDQVETFLLRVEGGSGLDGLSSMSSISDRAGISLVRPLLGVPKIFLREYLNSKRQTWIEDPSNQSLAFRRTAIRGMLTNLKDKGISASRINAVINNLDLIRCHLSSVTQVFFERAVRILPEAFCIVDLSALKSLPKPIMVRVLIKIILVFNNKIYPPRRRSIKHLIENIRSLKIRNFTLGGCYFVFRGPNLFVCRDPRSISTQKVFSGDKFIWDSVFNIVISGPQRENGKLSALGEKGWIEIVQKCPELKNIKIPHPVVVTLPTLFDEFGVIEVPGLRYHCGCPKKLSFSIERC